MKLLIKILNHNFQFIYNKQHSSTIDVDHICKRVITVVKSFFWPPGTYRLGWVDWMSLLDEFYYSLKTITTCVNIPNRAWFICMHLKIIGVGFVFYVFVCMFLFPISLFCILNIYWNSSKFWDLIWDFRLQTLLPKTIISLCFLKEQLWFRVKFYDLFHVFSSFTLFSRMYSTGSK